ncbi:uncharacterized protein ACJ7VT_017030 [Polymixia lowei]
MAIKLCCFPKDPLEDVDTWGESVDKVLGSKAGQIAFREFLKSEYSEENILFWLACEEYKKIKNTPEMISSANRIYSEFVETEAPKQINIDCGTREKITNNISQPTLTSFDAAQKLIYSLMARDCYPRFLKSDVYQGLLRRADSRAASGQYCTGATCSHIIDLIQIRMDVSCKTSHVDHQETKIIWSTNETHLSGESLKAVLSRKCGRVAFRDFLKSEFCEENLDFWLTCEEFKTIDSPGQLTWRARSIYEEFIRTESPKEINVDFYTRDAIAQNLQQPSPSCFAVAQKKIYSLMENDAFPRFIQSEYYKDMFDAASVQRNIRKHRKAFRSKSNENLV